MTVDVHERLCLLAGALCLTPGPDLDLVQKVPPEGLIPPCWWLVGCLEGDEPLTAVWGPQTREEALEAAERWLTALGLL